MDNPCKDISLKPSNRLKDLTTCVRLWLTENKTTTFFIPTLSWGEPTYYEFTTTKSRYSAYCEYLNLRVYK
jgi:hypothetical protein